jgi:hypothetical protein
MKRILLLFVTSTMLSGCLVMVPGHLYPVQGSLASQTPVPVYQFTINGVGNSGTMSTTLPGGEVCRGNWARVQQNDPSASKFSADWDRVYGEGFFVANVLGNSAIVRAVLVGNNGTTLNVEFHALTPGEPTNNVKGIAVDNNGNIFKLTF